jgi:pyrroloquinoline quinone (PQQ) biosynthesis protein C
MARSATAIQTEIDAIEAQLPNAIASASYSIAGRSKSNQTLDALTKRLDVLYQQLGRANGTAPMLVRGVPKGLR